MSEKKLIKAEQAIFNNAVDLVEDANQDLLRIYSKAQAKLEAKVAVLKVKIEKGLFNEFDEKRLKRLNSFIDGMKQTIIDLKKAEYKIFVDGFVQNYANTYIDMGFSLETYVNNNLVSGDKYVSLGYNRPNLAFMQSLYKKDIAPAFLGGSLNQRIAADVAVVTRQMRQAVGQAIQEGISVKEFTKRLENIDGVLAKSFSNAQTTARTELLRGYSIGNEEAINVSKDAGVSGVELWDATLDGKTRPEHAEKDQTEPDSDGLYHFSDGSAGVAPRMPGISVGNSANCRCSKNFIPDGFEPTARTATVGRGTNKERILQKKGVTAKEWLKTQDGQRAIKEEKAYRKARAKRLKK